MKLVSWFSCGIASAVATKILLNRCSEEDEIAIVRIEIPEEHPDNDRFSSDCAAWFGREIHTIKSHKYTGCEDVWAHQRYMSGIHGASCTRALKSEVRREFQRDWAPDLQAFGFTYDERPRADRFRENNPEVGLVCPLHKDKITKDDCYDLIMGAGIAPPIMYFLGFRNNNCIGCVKSSSVKYWQNVRKHFPAIFARRASLSRALGVRLVKVRGQRIFLDELDVNFDDLIPEQDIDCSILCVSEDAA